MPQESDRSIPSAEYDFLFGAMSQFPIPSSDRERIEPEAGGSSESQPIDRRLIDR